MLDNHETTGADVPASSLGEWITGSWSHCGLHVFEVCSASCLCAVLVCALCMPLRGLLALGAAHRVQGAQRRV